MSAAVRQIGHWTRRHRFEIVLAAPLLLFMVLLTVVPVAQVIAISFDANGAAPGFRPGLANYREIFGHFQFLRALRNTLVVTFAGLLVELTLGLFVAVQLNKRLAGRGLLRSLYLIPLGVPTIVAAASMRYVFDTSGFINGLLLAVGLIDVPIDWCGGGALTLFALVAADAWKVTPLVMLILLAGLESIPSEVYDAARMDGAYSWSTFRRVTLPLLKPSITMALVIRGIDSFRIFELPLVIAGRTEPMLATFAYAEYSEALNPYTSAADSVILFVMILFSIVAYLYLTRDRRLTPRDEHVPAETSAGGVASRREQTVERR